MKLICAALGIAAMCAAGAAAQSETTHDSAKRKIEVKDGKKVTVRGCLERDPAGGYMLTNDLGRVRYELVTNKDLSKDIDRYVAVRGKASDRGDAKVKVESKVGTTGTTDDRHDKGKAKSTTEMKGDVDAHYLGVDSVKRLARSCR